MSEDRNREKHVQDADGISFFVQDKMVHLMRSHIRIPLLAATIERPNIYSVLNNLIERYLVNRIDVMHAELTFRRHDKTTAFGGSSVNCLNDIDQLNFYIDKC